MIHACVKNVMMCAIVVLFDVVCVAYLIALVCVAVRVDSLTTRLYATIVVAFCAF